MGTDTVKSTPEAIAAVRQMKTILEANITESLNSFKTQGDIAANPEFLEGGGAAAFRDEWNNMKTALANTVTNMQNLRDNVDLLNANIQQAGGNA